MQMEQLSLSSPCFLLAFVAARDILILYSSKIVFCLYGWAGEQWVGLGLEGMLFRNVRGEKRLIYGISVVVFLEEISTVFYRLLINKKHKTLCFGVIFSMAKYFLYWMDIYFIVEIYWLFSKYSKNNKNSIASIYLKDF